MELQDVTNDHNGHIDKQTDLCYS